MILDRRPRLALIAGGLILTGAAAVLIARPFWHPMLTPRVVGGAVVGVDLVIVPVVLGRVSRASRMTWGVMAVGGGCAFVAATLLEHWLGWGFHPMEGLWEATFLGASGGLVVGGGLVLVVTALLPPGEAEAKHVGWVEERTGDAGGEEYVAGCDCGWRGDPRPEWSPVFAEAGNHAGRVRPSVRRAERTPPRSSGD